MTTTWPSHFLSQARSLSSQGLHVARELPEDLEAALADLAASPQTHPNVRIWIPPWVAEKIATPMGVPIESDSSYTGVQETKQLRINAEKAKRELGWDTRLSIETAVAWTSIWYQGLTQNNARAFTLSQINDYQKRLNIKVAA